MLKGVAAIFDLDKTIGEPFDNVPLVDGNSSASLLCWEFAASELLTKHNLIPRVLKYGIWSPEINKASTDNERAFLWLRENDLFKFFRAGYEYSAIDDLLEMMDDHYSSLTDQFGTDFAIFPEVHDALTQIKAAGGRGLLWTGNTAKKARRKAAPLLKDGLIEVDPMYTGEALSKSILLGVAGDLLRKGIERIVVVGDSSTDEKTYADMQREGFIMRGGGDWGFARRIAADSKIKPPDDLTLPKPLVNSPSGIFFGLGDPLFNLLAMGPDRLCKILLAVDINVNEVIAINNRLSTYSHQNNGTFPYYDFRDELGSLLRFIFSGRNTLDVSNNPEATRLRYNSLFWDYLLAFTFGRGFDSSILEKILEVQCNWNSNLLSQFSSCKIINNGNALDRNK